MIIQHMGDINLLKIFFIMKVGDIMELLMLILLITIVAGITFIIQEDIRIFQMMNIFMT